MDRELGEEPRKPLGERIGTVVGVVCFTVFMVLLCHLAFGSLVASTPPDPGYHSYELETPQPVEGP